MQFHLNGFVPGDPRIAPIDACPRATACVEADAFDVIIVGAGPAGLTLATQLAQFPEIKTLLIEQKDAPISLGQADGIACRTVEMFEAFGFADRVVEESYWVNETSFWKPDSSRDGRIVRSGRIQDVEDGLSEFPHVILNQARVHDHFLAAMRNAPANLQPLYSRKLVSVARSGDESVDYPVELLVERCEAGREGVRETLRARYVVGCDGARSSVRRALGRSLEGDSANQAWGVMDVLALTDFPDIRLKAAIHSAGDGSILIIPREGGYLVRLYVELDKLAENERVTERNITVERLIAAAQRILAPYSLEVKEVVWWSFYEIGQRLCDKFDDVDADAQDTVLPRVFIAGDACHTHSPKAGQGMNVSMQDGFNLGWKLASVLLGRAKPDLLHTYSAERQAIAKELIEFDRAFAAMFSAPARKPGDPEGAGIDPADFQRYFVRQGRFTAGTETRYGPSLITGATANQDLAAGFPVGMRFHSAPVIRLADAKPMHLGHVVKADGRWRVFMFAGRSDAGQGDAPVAMLCHFLDQSPSSPVRRFTAAGADVDSIIDLRAVFQQGHRELPVDAMPDLLQPQKGRFGLRDYEKIFCADPRGGDIFDMRGVDRDAGCVVVVRPDQYVAQVLPLDCADSLAAFFAEFMIAPDAALCPARPSSARAVEHST